eukprot:8703218-Pyramimonas_sp.AAC.1
MALTRPKVASRRPSSSPRRPQLASRRPQTAQDGPPRCPQEVSTKLLDAEILICVSHSNGKLR